MANISTIKEAILLSRESDVTLFIWGHRGLGKSSLVQQIAEDCDWGFVDMRCSQLEAADMRGLPDRGEDGRTHYFPPSEMPTGDLTAEEIKEQLGPKPDESDLEKLRIYKINEAKLRPRNQNGILFLDELNRAQDDVLQAAFQLVLDKKIGEYVVPPGWAVVVAGNFNEGYLVNSFNDPAFLDRFSHVTLSSGETTLDEWVEYMASIHGEAASDAIEFAAQNPKHLDGNVDGQLGFSIQPSRRSWDAVIRIEKICNKISFDDQAKFEVIAGLIGRELAMSYSRYSCPVKPKLLLKDGVGSHEDKLKLLTRNQLTGLMWGLVSFCKNKIDEDDVAEVCLDFASFMCDRTEVDNDIVVAFCRAMVGEKDAKMQQTQAALVANPKVANMISKFKGARQDSHKSFIDRITERPELQKALSHVAWGGE